MTTALTTTPSLSDPSPDLVLYVAKLKDPIDLYQRYFDALLVKRTRQARFFRDLKLFRRQPAIVALFQNPPQGQTVEELRASNREITHHYLNSTYSHPWCHASNVKTPNLNSKAERRKSNYGESPVGSTAEEERLHKLLVPIWCVFRGRMNPTDKQMEAFRVQQDEKGVVSGGTQASTGQKWTLGSTPSGVQGSGRAHGSSDDDLAGDYTDNDDSSIDSEGAPRQKNETLLSQDQEENANAQAIGKVFVGAAAASFFLQNKRIRKYLLKKSKK